MRNRPLPSLMADLAKGKVTGTLSSTSGGQTREIMFTNGEIRAARSYVEDEKLGTWLVEQEVLTEDDRALMLLAQGGGGDEPFGQILIEKGYLTLEVLDKELEQLALEIIRRAARAKGAENEFIDGAGEGQLDTLPNVVTSEVILLAAREFSDVDAIREMIGSTDRIIKLRSSLNDMLEEVQLTPTEGFLLSRLDGAGNLTGLIRLSSLPEEDTYLTLYPLLLSGTVVILSEDGEPLPEPEVESTAPPEEQVREEVPQVEEAPAEDTGETKVPEEKLIEDEPSGEKPATIADDATERTEDGVDFTEKQLEERRFILKLSEDVTKVDHYRALGLKRTANPNEVDDAWKKLQNRYSPDSVASYLTDMTSHLERIVERGRAAHEVLSSLRDRSRYDKILRSLDRDYEAIEKSHKEEEGARARRALVEANIKRADELIKQDEFFLAIQLLEQACSIQPRPRELIKLSRLLQRNPPWVNRALACLRRAIETDPKNVEAWLELADFWRRRNHAERQRKSLERVLAIDPDHEEANQMYKDLVGNRELQRLLRRARQMR
ncbi:MAG: hypothetical protein LJE93_05120 [Acidobacteria bacterium]|nr:hypothetical protein [Acidobacteriota bacterium]